MSHNTTMPATSRFVVSARPDPRKGKYAVLVEQLKALAILPEPEGLVIEFGSIGAGSLGVTRMATFADEDGFNLYSELVGDGTPKRRVWLERKDDGGSGDD